MRIKTDKVGLSKNKNKACVLTIRATIIALLEQKIIFKILGNTAADTNNKIV